VGASGGSLDAGRHLVSKRSLRFNVRVDLPGDRTAGTGRDAGRGGGVQIDVLGPVRAMVDGRPVDLGSPKQRVVLAVLISAEGRPVSVDRVIDLVWPEAPPVRARHSVQQYVSRLRAALEPARPRRCDPAVLRSEPAGYSIALGADQVDMRRFIRDEAAGVGALCDGDAATAVKCWRRALSHWRGPAYADLSGEPFADAETARLEELRMFTIERRIAAELDLGHGPELVPELQDLVRVHPLREALWGQLMVCLYRAGRQAEALATYQRVRGLLAEQLGLDPGPGLQGLERAILGGDLAPPKISGPEAPAPSAPGAAGGGWVCPAV
jgi:DNA-binding SARP family transcriptional activator